MNVFRWVMSSLHRRKWLLCSVLLITVEMRVRKRIWFFFRLFTIFFFSGNCSAVILVAPMNNGSVSCTIKQMRWEQQQSSSKEMLSRSIENLSLRTEKTIQLCSHVLDTEENDDSLIFHCWKYVLEKYKGRESSGLNVVIYSFDKVRIVGKRERREANERYRLVNGMITDTFQKHFQSFITS